jgi:hypothetical protein
LLASSPSTPFLWICAWYITDKEIEEYFFPSGCHHRILLIYIKEMLSLIENSCIRKWKFLTALQWSQVSIEAAQDHWGHEKFRDL